MALLELVAKGQTPSSRNWLVIGRGLGVLSLIWTGLMGLAPDTTWDFVLVAAICLSMVALDVIIRETGHIMAMEKPDEYAESIRSFFDDK